MFLAISISNGALIMIEFISSSSSMGNGNVA